MLRAAGSAVGAFTCYDVETAQAVLGVAEELRQPVILLVGAQSFAAPGGDLLMTALTAMAARAPEQAWVQLDHSSDLELMARAFGLGAAAVMADGSRLAYAENCDLVAQAVALARRYDGIVEAELGGITGEEDVAEAVAAGALTDPLEAADFVERTGAHCLAVSIGNVHGFYREPPRLDWERLAEIRRATGLLSLSLHGASGLADDVLETAIASGIVKVNVNTELREAYLAATAAQLPSVVEGLRLLELHQAQRAAVAEVVAAKLARFRAQ